MKTLYEYGEEFAELMIEETFTHKLTVQKMRRPYPMPDADVLKKMENDGMSMLDDEDIEEFWEGFNSTL